MFNKYVIFKSDEQEVLYLYLSNENYNISKIKTIAIDYINTKNIAFKGHLVCIVLDEKIIFSFYYSVEEIDNDEAFKIKLKQKDTTICLSMKNYLLGVMANESIPTFENEALKAHAVLLRTYAFKKMLEQGFVDEINDIQCYKDISFFKLLWMENYDFFYKKFIKAIKETSGEYLAKNGTMIKPYFHLAGNGVTETKENEYLVSVGSVWDLDDKLYLGHFKIKKKDMAHNLNVLENDLEKVKITKKSKSNRNLELIIGNKLFDGKIFTSLLGLPSEDFTITLTKDEVYFTTRGRGDGLGMSLTGANGMANNRYSYYQILKHYFPLMTIWKLLKNNQQ
ncbi:MAG: SpoIID/LytB domain-containing protein [Bacilli bacterium]